MVYCTRNVSRRALYPLEIILPPDFGLNDELALNFFLFLLHCHVISDEALL